MSGEGWLSLALGGMAMSWLLSGPTQPDLTWYAVTFPRELDPDHVLGFLRALAGERRGGTVVFEAIGHEHRVEHRIGVEGPHLPAVVAALRSFVPGADLALIAAASHAAPHHAWKLDLSTHQRTLRTEEPLHITRALLTALAQATGSQTLILQIVLGRRLAPNHVPSKDFAQPLTNNQQLIAAALSGRKPMDATTRSALREKVSQAGFKVSLRIGVASANEGVDIAKRLMAALRTAEGPGVSMRFKSADTQDVAVGAIPRKWNVALNVTELLPLLGWPLGGDSLPGVSRSRSARLPAIPEIPSDGRVIGTAGKEGGRRLALSSADTLYHLHVLGPTGTGKSTLLLNSALQEIKAGHSVLVVDPKGDLVQDILARMPEDRLDDLVVLDPADHERPVGLNPLACAPDDAELAADHVLAVVHGLYRDNWGPRTQDILHASLLTLAGQPDASLCAVPVLLANAAYRRRLISGLTDEIALKPFWAWYERLSEAERQHAIGPVMNKLRSFLLRPRMRTVLGQAKPSFDFADLFRAPRVVLVSLAKGAIGVEASALLGSLVVSQFWQATTRQIDVPAHERRKVMAFIDEFQEYLHLPTSLNDVFTQARGLGVSLTAAHQHFNQLPADVRATVLANARSRVVFQLDAEDAALVAKRTPLLEAEDFMGLGAYEAYAALVVNGNVAPFTSIHTLPPPPPSSSVPEARARSRERYGQPIEEVEAAITALVRGEGPIDPPDERPTGRRRRT